MISLLTKPEIMRNDYHDPTADHVLLRYIRRIFIYRNEERTFNGGNECRREKREPNGGRLLNLCRVHARKYKE